MNVIPSIFHGRHVLCHLKWTNFRNQTSSLTYCWWKKSGVYQLIYVDMVNIPLFTGFYRISSINNISFHQGTLHLSRSSQTVATKCLEQHCVRGSHFGIWELTTGELFFDALIRMDLFFSSGWDGPLWIQSYLLRRYKLPPNCTLSAFRAADPWIHRGCKKPH